jgi:hypothetical protein
MDDAEEGVEKKQGGESHEDIVSEPGEGKLNRGIHVAEGCEKEKMNAGRS